MTAKKRVISIISIISLVFAIALGALLSVGLHSNNGLYSGGGAVYSNTSLIVAESSVKTDDSVPEGITEEEIVSIQNDTELKAFINDSTKKYGYLTADISLDWDGVGSQAIFHEGRILDGRGFSITLADAQATATISKPESDGASWTSSSGGQISGYTGSFTNPISDSDPRRTYGLLVDYNMGTIKNIKFVFNQTSHFVTNNSASLGKNFVGIVTGVNTGVISNCDLSVSGAFGFVYCNGTVNVSSDTTTFYSAFGGFTGVNSGKITNISAKYQDAFKLILNTRGQNSKKTVGIQSGKSDATSLAGGIAGVMYSKDSECSNIVITSTSDVVFSMVAQRVNATGNKANAYLMAAAVVAGNSSYSRALGGIGTDTLSQAKVDNIVVDFPISYPKSKMGTNEGDADVFSQNAVVHCGKNTNVTVLNTYNGGYDYQTDNCNCSNGAQHDTSYGNFIEVDEYSKVTVSAMDGKQFITVEPMDKDNIILGELHFSRYLSRTNDGFNDDDGTDPDNSDIDLYNQENVRSDKYIFEVPVHQVSSSQLWGIEVASYQIATISEVDTHEYTYSGEDFLKNQLVYNTVDRQGAVNVEFVKAMTQDDSQLQEGKLPGEYNFTLQEVEAGLSYVDKENKVVAFVEDELTQYNYKVNLADIIPLDTRYTEEWITSPVDFTFALAGGIDGAADGYSYTVNGSQPTPINSLVMKNNVDTGEAGRTYTLYLTSGGVQVTNPYTYTVRVDVNAPEVDIINYEHPTNQYFTHNVITFSAIDDASGIASIIMNSYDSNNQIVHTHDVMQEGTVNADGTYTWTFRDSGRKEFIVTDNVGHQNVISDLKVNINTTLPQLNVEMYYLDYEEIGSDENGDPIYSDTRTKVVPYVSGDAAPSTVYFKASAEFGESGGEIRYSVDGGATWSIYTDEVAVKREARVKFRAVSNTYDHPVDDVDSIYRLVDNWGDQTVVVRIQLQEVVIARGDLVIENSSKVFDGNNTFYGSVRIRDGFIEDNHIDGNVIITSVVYSDINAGSVELNIEVYCTDDTKVMDNQITGAMGEITKKSISVTVNDKVKVYGVAIPQLTYEQVGMVDGYEEDLTLYVETPEGFDRPLELLPMTGDGSGYPIKIESLQLVNYEITSSTEGRLRITLAPVDRLVYEKGEFTGLDLNNIAQRNLEIGFIRSNGNYERLNVTFYALETKTDDLGGIVSGYTKKVDDITKAGAGFFKVVITLPEFDSIGEELSNKYVIDAKISEFMIKIIDSTIFEKDEEDEEEQEPSENQSVDASINNNAPVGKYEENGTNTDSTDINVEPSAKPAGDYVVMISIFCAVAIVMVFAFGIGKAIVKRAKTK